MRSLLMTTLGFLAALHSSATFAGFESGGGASPVAPIIPEIDFTLKCTMTWITESAKSSAKMPISRAKFSLTPEKSHIDATKLRWTHGYTESFNPEDSDLSANGKGEAIQDGVVPDSVQLSFDWANPEIESPKKPQLKDYLAQMEVSYYARAAKNFPRVFHSAATSQNLQAKEWNVSGRIILPRGEGAKTSRLSRFHLRCERGPGKGGPIVNLDE